MKKTEKPKLGIVFANFDPRDEGSTVKCLCGRAIHAKPGMVCFCGVVLRRNPRPEQPPEIRR